ncbi:MAG: hypothetical protein ACRDYE_12775, partial [Acidimicrobiales bacterium]
HFLQSWLDGAAGQAVARQSVQLIKQLNGSLTGIYTQDGAKMANAQKTLKSSDFQMKGSWDGTTVHVHVGHICIWTLMCASGGRTSTPTTPATPNWRPRSRSS